MKLQKIKNKVIQQKKRYESEKTSGESTLRISKDDNENAHESLSDISVE